MKGSSDCPGRFKCHGPASWCDHCGDVDLVCDDPNWEAHARGEERMAKYRRLYEEFGSLVSETDSKRKEMMMALDEWNRWNNGNPVMVARGIKPKTRT